MDRQETLHAIAIMQAWTEGKRIQCEGNKGNWFDLATVDNPAEIAPCWRWDEGAYRIKPEPRVIYVNEYEGRLGGSHYLEEGHAECSIQYPNYVGTRKFIEVID